MDVVYVVTPHPMHHANTLLALEADKPALVERAFTMTAAEAGDLVDTARSKGLFLMEQCGLASCRTWPRSDVEQYVIVRRRQHRTLADR